MAINKKNLLKLADALEGKMPKGFKWDFWNVLRDTGAECGTSGCAIGLGIIVGIIPATPGEILHRFWGKPARKALGVTERQYDVLFMGCANYPETKSGQVTPKTVAKAVRKFVATGELPQ